jgi:NAD-reducing hydrogenase large subunit
VRDSYLKYFKPLGYPAGVYRVGPLARLNVAASAGTPRADRELEEFRQRFGAVVHARLIELLHALETMEALLADPAILGTWIRARAGVNAVGRRWD